MLSVAEEGARVGVRILGVRYFGGSVVVSIQDLFVEEGLSIFCAAAHVMQC